MTPKEIQSELKRHLNILSAANDYLIESNAGRIKWDEFDPAAQHYQKLKEKTEKYYQTNNLRGLQKLFQVIVAERQQIGDLNFGSYIKEKTGYDFNIFEDLQGRITGIVERGKARNEKEYQDVVVMIMILQQTGADQGKMAILASVRNTFDERRNRRKPVKSDKYFSNELYDTFSPDHKHRLIVHESGNSRENATTCVTLNSQEGGASVFIVNGINLGIKAYWKDNATIVIETKKDYQVVSRKCQQLQIFSQVFTIKLIEN